MKCVFCGQRKGKRQCPALRGLICPVCCGTKRVVEIACPSNCPYLVEGQRYAATQNFLRQLRAFDNTKLARRERVVEKAGPLLHQLEMILVEQARTDRSITDWEVEEALSLLIKTYETEQKGILYDQRSSRATVQQLMGKMRQTIEELRTHPSAEAKHVSLGDALDCLLFLQDEVALHRDLTTPRAFLSFLLPFFPEVAQQSSSHIILP
ncbi:MAG: hypothetical protein HY652_10180 [Acidobacteria bacterium]|nr:hypothetical protein [Acidobacteriota bacterium]